MTRQTDGRYGYQAAQTGPTPVPVTCDRCRAETAGPVWRGIRAVPSGETYLGLPLCNYVQGTLCAACADETGVTVYGSRPCAWCGRVTSYGGTNSHPVTYCTRQHELSARTARRRRARQLARMRRCGTCGNPFTAPRSDARYCSAACKQRAYRKRAADVTAERARARAVMRAYDEALNS